MDYNSFKRILTAFADTPASIDVSKGRLVCEIRDEMIEASTRVFEGEVWITENDEEMRATTWLLKRVARLPLLADRILTAFEEPEYFVSPKGSLSNQLDEDASSFIRHGDASDLAADILSRRPGGCSNVLYLTSDAGEGKTTLISHLARLQAQKYKLKETDWLIVPIALGGKPFLRFDDLVVGFLGNKLRFPIFYFDAFMELVKLGAIVPAFDGFEEMFVQSPHGDALSAVGNLMRTLNSSGTVLIAARKAYFEYQDIRTQARLFDSIGANAVVFSKLQIERWEKKQFFDYCEKRLIPNGQQIHEGVAERLKENHPLLSRAVLVKRLIDMVEETGSLTELLKKIGNAPNDYFAVFVRAIIEREANTKWIDLIGEPHVPMLTVEEHFELLSTVAQEMWANSTDSLSDEVLDAITELYCESRRLAPEVTFQIKERTKQHALIVGTTGMHRSFSFDHEEFKNFFLGEAIGRISAKANPAQKVELLTVLRKGSLPGQAVDAAISAVKAYKECDCDVIAKYLQEVASMDGPTSFTHENVGRLLIKILDAFHGGNVTFSGLTFGEDSLRDLHLSNVAFKECTFAGTSFDNTKLVNCRFEECHFGQLNLHETTQIEKCVIYGGDIVSIGVPDKENPVFDPTAFPAILRHAGFELSLNDPAEKTAVFVTEDPNILVFKRFLRMFQIKTHLDERSVQKRLGVDAAFFLQNVIPLLVRAGVLLSEINEKDKQHWFRMTMPMERIYAALHTAPKSIEMFVAELTSRSP